MVETVDQAAGGAAVSAGSRAANGNRHDVDWSAVATDFRPGVLTVRAIAQKYGVSAARVSQKMKELGIERDLGPKIQARLDAKLNRDAINAELNNAHRVKEADIVEAVAELRAAVLRNHRADIPRARRVAMDLLAEIEEMTQQRGEFQQLAEILANGEGISDALLNKFRRTIGLSDRVDNLRKTAETLKVLVSMEREAFGIDKHEAEDHGDKHVVVEFVRTTDPGG